MFLVEFPALQAHVASLGPMESKASHHENPGNVMVIVTNEIKTSLHCNGLDAPFTMLVIYSIDRGGRHRD